jgi:predicted MFS family arabinose efflux permease
VTGLESTTERLAGFVAFAIAGALITLVSEVNAPWIDAASFGVCAVLIARWIPRQHQKPRSRTREAIGSGNSLADAVCWTGVPLGGVVAGAAIAGIGLAPALLAAGAVYFVATMSPLLIGRHEKWKATQDLTGPQETAAGSDPAAVPTT